MQTFNDLCSNTKTVVGHNLDPTPWHPFFPRTDKPTAFSLIRCSYFNSCPKLTSRLLMKPSHTFTANPLPSECPSFFSSIYRDLAPWSQTGISLSLIENTVNQHAAFRVVIKDSKLYVDLRYACVQSRMLFTIWGLLQLVRRYPGLVPDVDMVFDCMDRPVVNRTLYAGHGAPIPPPVFRYCTTKEHLDIPFPDWSFWGW